MFFVGVILLISFDAERRAWQDAFDAQSRAHEEALGALRSERDALARQNQQLQLSVDANTQALLAAQQA